MSAVTRFMQTAAAATAILDERDRRAEQPPFFTRTTWLFAELVDMALPAEADIFKAITIARLHGDVAQIGRLVDQVHAGSVAIDDPGKRHQRQQICGWIKDQIRREQK